MSTSFIRMEFIFCRAFSTPLPSLSSPFSSSLIIFRYSYIRLSMGSLSSFIFCAFSVFLWSIPPTNSLLGMITYPTVSQFGCYSKSIGVFLCRPMIYVDHQSSSKISCKCSFFRIFIFVPSKIVILVEHVFIFLKCLVFLLYWI
jgi:hypothetical protein